MTAIGPHHGAGTTATSRAALFSASKFVPPRLPRAYVARPRLQARLESSPRTRLTVMTGPAGSGKSTLAAAFVADRAEHCSWITFDAGDNEVNTVWAALSHGFDRLFAGARSPRPQPDAASAEQFLRSARELDTESADPRLLVLDGLDALTDDIEREVLTRVADALPASVHLVIATRRQPLVRVHRLRATSDVVEIGAADLRFTAAEAAALVDALPPSAIVVTDGWATGLLLAYRGRTAPADGVRRVRDYLYEEVVAPLPPDARRFLTEVSCLGQLDVAACAHVTGRPDAADLLRSLARANAFVEADETHWGRYHLHPQLGAMLRDELRAAEPRRAAELFAAGARWYESRGDVVAAIDQWLDAGHEPEALALLREASVRLGYTRPDRLSDWTTRISPVAAEARPELLLDLAVASSMGNDEARARDLSERVDELLRTNPDPLTSFRSMLLHARLALGAGDIEGQVAALDAAQRIAASEPAVAAAPGLYERPLARHLTAWLALADSWIERPPTRNTRLEERPNAWSEQTADRVLAWGVDASLALTRGDLETAAAQASRAQVAAHAEGLTGYIVQPAAHVLAALLHERAEIDVARAAYEELAEQMREPAGNTFWIAAQLGLALVMRTQGDLTGALERLSRLGAHPDGYARTAAQRWVNRATVLTHLRLGQLAAAREVLGPPPWIGSEIRIAALIALAEGRAAEAEQLTSSLRRQAPRARLFGSIVDARVAKLRGEHDVALRAAADTLVVAQEHGFLRSVLDFGSDLLPEIAAGASSAADAAYVARLRESAERGTYAFDSRRATRDPVALSDRELDVLRYLATNLSTREIAEALHVSRNTVKSHQQHVYRKLDVASREAAVARARALQLLR
jgi:LuxR family maltose regulon positive regulatory protein